ncbi:MAG: ATP-dependent helicase [Thermodesulfobacteriaceae bacterium]|jgi:DNA helicase-2/ATP-dependent DNA helicase PcrA
MPNIKEILEKLNPAQREAVESIEGPVLVIAGAGSGKTRTLTTRLAYLVSLGIPAEKILLLTFTRKAAREMISRAEALVGNSCGKVQGGTFHSLCHYMLRQYGYLLGFSPNFTVLDRGDSEDLLNLLKNSLGFPGAKRHAPKKETLATILSKIKNQGKTLEEIITTEYPNFVDLIPQIERLFKEYELYKREHQLMDYDDLLINWLTILKEYPQVREEVGRRYNYIMVDEYQDTNLLQGEIVVYMASSHRNVMAVGDDSQSIYGFRGANYRNIFDFPKYFPEARIIKLEQNYRSTQSILDLANAIIERSKIKYTKVLFSNKKEGPKPILFRAKDDHAGSEFVADEILRLTNEEGIPLSQIAVLMRAAFHSYDLELELTKRGIPFVKYGGLKLLESAHIKDVVSILRILVNPYDFLSWNRVLLLLEGVGPRSAERIVNLLKTSDLESAIFNIKRQFSQPELQKLLHLFQELMGKRLPPFETLSQVLSFYEPIFERTYYEDSHRRERDLESLIALSEKYETLEEFLTDLVLEPIYSSEVEGERKEEILTLSTIHSAKGLEWHTVFVLSVIEGRFPSSYSLLNPEELEEERRLFYVAVTRAKERLYLIAPLTIYVPGEGRTFAKLSRFLQEVPKGLYVEYGKQEEPLAKAQKEEQAASINMPFKVGDLVRHPRFGEGEVMKVLDQEKVMVNFVGKGPTLLHLKYATLERLSP